MARGKGLTETAGVESIHRLIGHLIDTFISGLVFGPSGSRQFINIFLVGKERNLNFINYLFEILMEFGMQHDTDILQGKALLDSRLADTNPGDIPLADMHDALDIVDQMVNLPLHDRLKVGLEFASGNLHEDTERQGVPFLHIFQILTDDRYLAVFYLIHLGHFHQLGTLGLTATHLTIEIAAAYPLTLKGRTEGTRNIDLGDIDFQAANFNGFLANFIMRYVGDNMLIGADTGRQDLRNIGVGKGRKAPVNTAGSSNRPFGTDVAQSINEGEDTVFVIHQHTAVIAWLHTAEGHGGTVGETESKNGGGNVRPEGDDTGIPTDLYTGLKKLLDDGFTVMVSGTEDIKIFLLIILDDHLGDLGIGSGTDDGGKTGSRTVNELYTAFSKNNVVGGTDPDFARIDIRIFSINIEIRLTKNSQGLFHLIGEDTGHTGIKKRSEIGKMITALDVRRQKATGKLHRLLQIFEGLAFYTGERIDNRKIICGIGESYFSAGVIGLKSCFQLSLHLGYHLIATLYCCKCY